MHCYRGTRYERPVPGHLQTGLLTLTCPTHPQGLCLEDVEDLEEAEPLPSGQAPSPHTLASPTAAAASRAQQPSLLPAAAGKEKLSPAKLAAACRLLWGAAGQPPSSWQQGFFFSETPGLEAGLVQQQGGLCGIASVPWHA